MKHFFCNPLCNRCIHLDEHRCGNGEKMASEYEVGQVRLGEFQLYTNGEELYTNLFEDIRNAEKYIYIHFYIVGKDEISKEFCSCSRKRHLAE